MNIRTYQPGDEGVQAEIYNEAASPQTRFKAATVEEVGRRCRAAGFDPGSRFFAESEGKVVGYCTFHPNGRISYPWCRPNFEVAAEPLFDKVLDAMRQRGMRSAFAAYRGDWPAQQSFFLGRGFHQAREMVNYVLEGTDMPTRVGQSADACSPLRREEVPALLELCPRLFRVASPRDLERHLFDNPYFPPESIFVLRSRQGQSPVAVGVLILNPAYADPMVVDAAMPCFRLGAFGTEGMQTKRINGLFSMAIREDAETGARALALLDHAVGLLDRTDWGTLAAQAPSDVPHLLRFYQDHFRRQGSFPVLEKML